MNNEFFEALYLLERERGIPVEFMLEKIRKAIVTACKSSYGNEDAVINIDSGSENFEVFLRKTVVEEVTEPGREISVQKAREIQPDAVEGDVVGKKLAATFA